MKNLSNAEKQILLDLMPLIDEDAKKKEDTIRAFKWLANVPQAGVPFEQNRNVFELQDKGIEAINQEQELRKQLLRKLINSV